MYNVVLTNNLSLISLNPIEGFDNKYSYSITEVDGPTIGKVIYYNKRFFSEHPSENQVEVYVKYAENLEDLFKNLVPLSQCPTANFLKKKSNIEEFLYHVALNYSLSSPKYHLFYKLEDIPGETKDYFTVIYKHGTKGQVSITMVSFEDLILQALKSFMVGWSQPTNIKRSDISKLLNKPIPKISNDNSPYIPLLL